MSNRTRRHCAVCNRPIGDRESVWGYHYGGGVAINYVGLECLFRIDGPEVAGILDYAEGHGVAEARRHIQRQLTSWSQAERSEPSGKP